MTATETFDVEAFADTLAEQVETNARMIDALDDIGDAFPDQYATAEGFQRSITEENRRFKDFVRILPVDVPEEDLPANWDDIDTLRD